MNSQRIFVAGSKGMVGSAIIRKLEQDQTCEIITASKQELNLTDQASVNAFFLKKIESIKYTWRQQKLVV